MAVGVGYR